MAIRTILRLLIAAFGLSTVCGAQNTSPQQPATPCPAANQSASQPASKPCTPPATGASPPSAAQQFPFPGETSQPDNPPAAPSPSHPSAASEHPYPGDPAANAGSSSSSSSSSSDDGDAPIGPPLKDVGSEGKSTRRKLPKVQKVQTDDERVDEDLRVAKFYLNDDNLPGAYLRAKDAVKVQPDYSETHFVLGEVAQKMKKKQEAVAEFQTYLKLDPKGERMKAAQRALDALK